MTQGTLQSKQAITDLVELSRIRVWSMVITIFGDAVVGRGGVVASSTLAALTAEMGVKPEAFRVAMSRLTKDGWLERSKQGRLSFYQLSQKGGAVFGPAAKRIYADKAGTAAGWRLVLLQSAVEDAPEDAISLGGRAYLTQSREDVVDGLILSGSFDAVPEWVKDRIGPEGIVQGYRDFLAVLQGLQLGQPTPLEAAVLRLLIVHQWRRLVLRHADLPTAFFPEGWHGGDCRAIVHQMLADLTPVGDEWFASEIP